MTKPNACSLGVLDSVKPLLKCCSNERFVNVTDENGDTALHLATQNGFTEIMKLLRKNKADLKIINYVSIIIIFNRACACTRL